MSKRQKLTQDEKLRRQADRKAAKANAKLVAESGLFLEEVLEETSLTDAGAEYWKLRQSWADAPRGVGMMDLIQLDARVDKLIMRNAARKVMTPADYALAVAKDGSHGDTLLFWRILLTGRHRMVLSYYRHVFGCRSNAPSPYYDGPPFLIEKRVEIGELAIWPPDNWPLRLTDAQVDAMIALPPAHESGLPDAADVLGLAAEEQSLTPHTCAAK